MYLYIIALFLFSFLQSYLLIAFLPFPVADVKQALNLGLASNLNKQDSGEEM